jgi:hypothetical protein
MRLRPRQWLIRGDWKQLAPDDAYLSCEYPVCLEIEGKWREREDKANTGWQITMFDVSTRRMLREWNGTDG